MGTIRHHYFIHLSKMTFLITFFLLCILLYGNLVKHDEYLLQALSVSPIKFFHLSALLIPYALSFALPFGFTLALLLSYGKWSSTNEILALRSLGQGIFFWGVPTFLISLLVSLFSLFIFLEWSPQSRSQFDQQKSLILWSNINLLLKTEKEIEFNLQGGETDFTKQSLATFSKEPVHKVSLSVGSIDKSSWQNLRISLFGEGGKLLRIINSKTANVEISPDTTKLSLQLKNVDLETALDEGGDGIFVSFEEWNKPLIFDLAQNSDPSNLKRLGIAKLLEFARSENSKGAEAQILIHKSFALGTSSLFLSLVLLPLSIMQSRKETMANLAVGILFCILYFILFTLLVEISFTSFSPVLIWFPNLLCFIIGSYLLYNFEN